MKKAIPIIVLILIVLGAVGGGLYLRHSNRTRFNDSYVNGNTAGNLYNHGLICEYQGTVYFANPSDGGRLYSMDARGGNLKKLSSDVVSFINVDDNYIYYVRNNPGNVDIFSFSNFNTNSLVRVDHNGNNVLVLDTEPALYASLVGNYIYYLHYEESTGTVLYKVKLDGSDQTQVSDVPTYTCSTIGQYIYYNGMQNNHYIWRLNTASDTEGLLYTGNCWMPTVVNETTAYYIDIDKNYALTRLNLATEEKTLLASDRVDWYNIAGSYIYFQTSDAEHPALCRMRTDGEEYEVIAEGIHKNICVTTYYVYFCEVYSGDTYRVNANTAGAVPELFDPGTAVKK